MFIFAIMSLLLMLTLVCSSFSYKLSTLTHGVISLEKSIHIQEELHDALAYACALFADDKKMRNELFTNKELVRQTTCCSLQYVLQKKSVLLTVTHRTSPHCTLHAILTFETINNKQTVTYQLVASHG